MLLNFHIHCLIWPFKNIFIFCLFTNTCFYSIIYLSTKPIILSFIWIYSYHLKLKHSLLHLFNLFFYSYIHLFIGLSILPPNHFCHTLLVIICDFFSFSCIYQKESFFHSFKLLHCIHWIFSNFRDFLHGREFSSKFEEFSCEIYKFGNCVLNFEFHYWKFSMTLKNWSTEWNFSVKLLIHQISSKNWNFNFPLTWKFSKFFTVLGLRAFFRWFDS